MLYLKVTVFSIYLQGVIILKQQMKIKDFISIGIYTSLYFITVALSAFLVAFILPGYSYVFIPVLSALLTGSIYMLMTAKVPKFGAISTMGSVLGIFFFMMGRFPGALPVSIIISLIADGIAYLFKYKNKKGLILSYIVFSFNTIGPVLPMFLFPSLYIKKLTEVGKDTAYIESAFSGITQNTFLILLISLFVAAIIGGIFGQKMMKKHFERAGII